MNAKTLTIILNWNGSKDSISCVASILDANHAEEDVLIIDNDSLKSDYIALKNYLITSMSVECTRYSVESLERNINGVMFTERLSFSKNGKRFFLLRAHSNYGFAKACNAGALIASTLKYDNILLLNNDTEVTIGYLDTMLSVLNNDMNVSAVIPQIRYHSDKKIIWNCGGDISRWGNRNYHYPMCNGDEVLFKDNKFDVSFATGCCILFKTDFFINIGMFTEKFFFGEEDIEFSLRLRRYGLRMVCAVNALIYHKVGSSISGSPEKLVRKAYIHYLNRFVNMKLNLHGFWWLWLLPSILKVFINLIKINKLSFLQAIKFISHLCKDAFKYNEVSKNTFERILSVGYLN